MFRARLRQFPSLVNCCTIDWFSAWPQEALQSVATSFLNELPELEASPTAIQSLVSKSVWYACVIVYKIVKLTSCLSLQALMCVEIHQMVSRKCEQYLAELSRYNYVTPKSYLELLSIFSSLIGQKKQELHSARQRMKTGLDKVIWETSHSSYTFYIIYKRGFWLYVYVCSCWVQQRMWARCRKSWRWWGLSWRKQPRTLWSPWRK